MTQPPSGRIVVIGATGYTGSLVAHELARRSGPRPDVVLAGRSAEKLDRLAAGTGAGMRSAVVDVEEPSTLAAVIRPGDAVINCAGPFAELGEPVVARCVEAGAAYIDTTGEQPWMRDIRARYHEPARAAGIPVVNGMAFEWALGDCGAAILARSLGGALRSLDVVYAWGGTAASRGTRRTSLRIIGTRAWELESGRWRRRPAASARRRFTFSGGRERQAVAFGAGEVVTVPGWSDPETVRGWLVMGSAKARLARALSPALPFIIPALRPLLEPLATRADDPSDRERAESAFTIRLEGESPSGDRGALEVSGTDPYGLTAAIAVTGALRALRPHPPAGVLAPSRLVEPASLLEGLADRGLRVSPER